MAPGNDEQLSEAELRRKSAAGTLTDAEAAQLNRFKGKGAAPQAEPKDADSEDDEDEEEEEEEEEDEEEGDEDDDDDAEEEQEEPNPRDGRKGGSTSAAKEPPKKKHKASSSKAGPSKKADDEVDSDVEILDGLSGDEVDASNIIEGGRRTRRGRATSAPKYTKQAVSDNSDDEW